MPETPLHLWWPTNITAALKAEMGEESDDEFDAFDGGDDTWFLEDEGVDWEDWED